MQVCNPERILGKHLFLDSAVLLEHPDGTAINSDMMFDLPLLVLGSMPLSIYELVSSEIVLRDLRGRTYVRRSIETTVISYTQDKENISEE